MALRQLAAGTTILALVAFTGGSSLAAGQAAPDLVVTAASSPNSSVQPGGDLKVTDKVSNVGRARASVSKTAYFLSLNGKKGGTDFRLRGVRLVPALARLAASRGSVPAGVPSSVPANDYYLLACADDRRRVSESDEGNNCRASTGRITVLPRDMTPPTAPSLTVGSTAGMSVSGLTLHFRPGTTGYFTLSATSSDPESGLREIRFPNLGSGWSGGGADPAAPYEATYSFNGSAGSPGALSVAATNAAGLSATSSFAVRADAIPPTASIACGGASCSSGPYPGSVSVSLSAADAGSGVEQIRYTTNGDDPTRSTGFGYFGPFAVSQSTTVRYRAYDKLGNASAVAARAIAIDTSAPAAPRLDFDFDSLDDTFPEGGTLYFRPGVTGRFALTASSTDTQSGIDGYDFPDLGPGWAGAEDDDSVTYTYDATAAEPAAGRLVTARNGAGGTSSTELRVQADTAGPTTSIRCGGSACASTPYAGSRPVSLRADDGTGSGVWEIRFTTDGTEPTQANGSLFSEAFTVPDGTTTIRFRAYDQVGNAGPIGRQTIQVDADPLDVTVNVAGSGAVSKRVGSSGGILQTTASDGSAFTLTIPSGALILEEDITMMPISSIGGFPFAGGLIAGVDLKPSGLALLKPATLKIVPSSAVSAAALTPFSYHGSGNDFQLAPLDPDSAAIELWVTHFSGSGIGSGTDAERDQQETKDPTTERDQFQQQAAALMRDLRACTASCGPISDALVALFRSWYSSQIGPGLEAAKTDDALAKSVLLDAIGWQRQTMLLGLDSHFGTENAAIAAAIPIIFLNAYERAWQSCLRFDLTAPMRMLAMVRQGQLLGVDMPDDLNDRLRRCLNFDLEGDWTYERDRSSSGSGDSYAQSTHVRLPRMSLEFGDVRNELTGRALPYNFSGVTWSESGRDPARAGRRGGVFRSFGGYAEARLDIGKLRFDQQPSPALFDLQLFTPTGFTYVPCPAGVSGFCDNAEIIRRTDDDGVSWDMPEHYWVDYWYEFHASERIVGGQPSHPLTPVGLVSIKGWQPGGRALIATKTYDREIEDQCPPNPPCPITGSATESVTLKIYHRPER